MLYLGIDQHARQLTISLRNEEGDVAARSAGFDRAGEDQRILSAAHPRATG